MKQQCSDFSGKNILNTVSKVLSWAIFVILLLAAAFLLYYYVATKIYAAKGPGYEPKLSIYTIISGSMEPKIHVYDTIVNQKVNSPDDIKVNDIITFVSTSLLSPGTTITHRVIGIVKDEDGKVCYQTKGDANKIADPSCAKFQNVIGKVVFKIPQLGRIQFFLASKAGWLLCILIPALVIICKDILKIFKLSNIKKTTVKIEEKKKEEMLKREVDLDKITDLKKKYGLVNEEKCEYYQEPEVRVIEKNNKKKG